MPPETRTPSSPAADAYARWRELRDVYDALETHVAASAWADAASLTPRIAALEQMLLPLMTASRAEATDADHTLWAAGDAIATDLADRRDRAFAAATEARNAVAGELARLARSRADARRYRPATQSPSWFARLV